MKNHIYNGPVQRILCMLSASVVFLGIMALGGCSGTEDDPITVNSPAAIAQESNADYDNNTNGLISGATLMRWLDNWTGNRPAGITGKLVILQTGTAGQTGLPDGTGISGRDFIQDDGVNVFTYAVSNDAWVLTRSNGVVYTPNVVADGPQIDTLLQTYNIDPTRDMIVFAMGVGGLQQNMIIGRGWYLFRYWGIAREHLAILNGGINSTNVIANGYFMTNSRMPTGVGKASVKTIRVDNTALQASLQEMLAVAKGNNIPVGGAFILDARGDTTNQYDGNPLATTTLDEPICSNGTGGSGSCYTAIEGNIRGSVMFDYTALLIDKVGMSANDSFRYDSKANIESLIMGAGYGAGNTVYTYCKTTYRAMVTGIATGVILGYPTRYYDGGWIEWGQLAWAANFNYPAIGSINLPTDSPWRTDLASASNSPSSDPDLTYNDPDRVGPLAPWLVDEYAASANVLIDEDKGYKWGDGADGGGGGAPPSGGGGGGCGG